MDEEFYLVEPTGPFFEVIDPSKVPTWQLDPEDLKASIVNRFFWGIGANRRAFVKAGVDAGLDLKKVRSKYGYTALTSAARFGSENVFNYLLSLNLNPAYCGTDMYKTNAFHAACLGGHSHIINILLLHPSQKITVNMLDHNNQSGLQKAITQLEFKCARKLIQQHNASTETHDIRGRNAAATALSILFVSTFDTDLLKNNRVQEWEDFCLELFANRNAFVKADPNDENIIAPISILFDTSLALNLVNPDKQYLNFDDAVMKVMQESPRLAALFYEHSKVNPTGELESAYRQRYVACLKMPYYFDDEQKNILMKPEPDMNAGSAGTGPVLVNK